MPLPGRPKLLLANLWGEIEFLPGIALRAIDKTRMLFAKCAILSIVHSYSCYRNLKLSHGKELNPPVRIETQAGSRPGVAM